MILVIFKNKKTKELTGYQLDVIPYKPLEYTQDEFKSIIKHNKAYEYSDTAKTFNYHINIK